MNFFTALNFTSSNEDGRTELAALSGAGPRLLCLTGSGTRPLDMLLSDAAEIIAIDMNPTQNALLRLKIAAFRALSHMELLAYLGIAPCRDRLALHGKVSQHLRPECAQFWARNKRHIRKGIWYAGRWEKVLRIGAKALRLIRGRVVNDLFDAPTPEAQAQIWDRHFDDWLWRGAIRMLGRPWFWTKIIGEPGGAFLPSPAQTEQQLAGAFRRAAQTFLFRDSDFASLMLRGVNTLPHAVPLHLLPENFDQIRVGLDRLRLVDGGLAALDQLGISNIDRFSLSDFGSYCDTAAYAACWGGILKAAAPGALFCERVFMNALPLPSDQIRVNPELSLALTQNDRAIIYDIRAGKIEISP